MNENSIQTDQFLTEIIEEGRYADYAKASHEIWKTTKESQGWTYGIKRDNEKKTNPLMVDFEDLSAETKGQNSLTPYAVVNFFRTEFGSASLSELETVLEQVGSGAIPKLIDKMGEYIHSHFVAAQLAKGDTVKSRDDLGIYERLSEDTRSWDTASALEVVKYLREKVHDAYR